MNERILEIGKRAKAAQIDIITKTTEQKNKALQLIAKELTDRTVEIIEENKKDIQTAKDMGLKESLYDRLTLNRERIADIAKSVLDVVQLNDPIGETITGTLRPNGLNILKQRVPLGVVGMIYEARPNVTVDAAILCLKTSNVAVLKGGKEAYYSNKKLVEIMRDAIEKAGFQKDCILFIDSTDRKDTADFMKLNGYIDVLIPRGSAGLINAVVKEATVPVIETGIGNCHIFIDESADFEMATKLAVNGKTQRPAVCNALESMLIHEKIAKDFLPVVYSALKEKGVTFLGCETCKEILGEEITLATEADYHEEFYNLTISVKVVKDLNGALAHIRKYSTKHSECIVTENYKNAQIFTQMVDAAAVYVNASTRFTDGAEFGFGAEIGISTQKLHARGPMGLEEMTSYKYVVLGQGQIRE